VLAVVGALLVRHPEHELRPAQEPVRPVVRGRVTVEVLNGTARQGIARTATRLLRGRGLDVVFVGNADSTTDSTRVVARRGDVQRANYVAEMLGAGNVLVETDTFRRVDVSVILGNDFRPRLPLHP
jgi:polyisoprenyl-teichoic acid--peptidoglycan teichoic acid transferase